MTHTPDAVKQLSDFAVATICEGHTLKHDLTTLMFQEAERRGLVWHWAKEKVLGTSMIQLKTSRIHRGWSVVSYAPGGEQYDNRRKK